MRSLSIVALLGLILTSTPVVAAVFEGCCACIEGHSAHKQLPVTQPALFCTFTTTPDFSAVEAQCDAATAGGSLICVPGQPAPTCAATLLADEAIACPPSTGAPILAPHSLAALAAILAAAGTFAVRRRRSS